jgi:peptidoglycan hydrolase-like protein with peptidoglycan-binding domain
MTDRWNDRLPPEGESRELVLHRAVGSDETTADANEQTGALADAKMETRPRRRWFRAPLVGIAAFAVIAGGIGLSLAGPRAVPNEDTPQTLTSTAAVTRGDVAIETRTAGALEFEGQASLFGGPSGIVTSLRSAGEVVSAGQPLYAVNAVPVLLLSGSLPAWRNFETGMGVGADVRQLEENLAAFGVFSGTVDDEFTGKTAEAIRAWQKNVGMPTTGSLARTDIVFSSHPVRVAELKTQVGQQVGEGSTIMTMSSTSKVVKVDLKVTQRGLAQINVPVAILLPDGQSVPGTVTDVGTAVERTTKNGETNTVIPVSVTITDQETINGVDQGGVQVLFTTATSENVLTVPIEALVPISDSIFGVEVPDTAAASGIRRVPVTVGVIGSGRAEISGKGIDAGVKVVVPEAVSGS